GKLALPQLDIVGLIVNCVVEGHFTVAIAMNIAKPNVFRIHHLDRIWRGLIAAYNAVHVQIGHGNVVRIADLKRQCEAALTSLLFRLECVDLPVRDVVQHDFVAHVVLAGELVDTSRRGCVGNIEARLGESAGCPDVHKSSTAAVGDPQAGILPVPAASYVGIPGVGIVVDLVPNLRILVYGRARLTGPVPAKETHIVHERIDARHPLHRYRTRVDTVRIEAEARHDIGSALWGLEEWFGTPYALKSRVRVCENNPRHAWVQADQHRVRL